MRNESGVQRANPNVRGLLRIVPALIALSGCATRIDVGAMDSSPAGAGGGSGGESSSSASGNGTTGSGSSSASGAPNGLPGLPIALATAQRPLALAVDEAFVFWTNDDGSVYRAPKDGGEVKELSPAVGEPALAIAVDATRVFWPVTASKKISEVEKAGGATSVLAEGVEAWDLAADGSNVFWPEHGLQAVPASGGPVSWLVYCGQQPIALDAANAYFPFPGGTTLRKAPKTGESAVMLASFEGIIASLAVFGAEAYVATDKGAVFRVPTAGGDPVEISSGLDVGKIAVDASGIYATTHTLAGPNRVLRIPLAGGAATVLANEQHAPGAIALDAGAVYWANGGPVAPGAAGAFPGAIMKVAKP
jgi:hypothetical protein